MDKSLGVALTRPLNLVLIFAPTIFLSAWLLFLIQPLFAKMALPLLGGAPAVWNTAMVFFQGALLLGYLYAHLLSRYAPFRVQLLVHGIVLVTAFLLLPVAIGAGWQNPPDSLPSYWLLGLLAVNIGLPFFAISANAPLLQRWFARTDHPDAHDPYFLYAASNVGSILALLGYPFLIEPNLLLQEQSWLWTGGYALLVVLIFGCGLLVPASRAGNAVATPAPSAETPLSADVSWRDRLHWIALAFVPSGLLLSVTAYITTDLVAMPLLWVIPLTLFLLTFVFVFARKPLLKHRWMTAIQLPLLIAAAVAVFLSFNGGAYIQMALVLVTFFVTAMVCHGELAKRRPAAERLTEFYLWMSFGGILGGAFTALAAPLLFDRVLEYPILLVLAALLRPRRDSNDIVNRHLKRWGRLGAWDVVLPVLCLVPVFAIDWPAAQLSDGESLLLKVGGFLLLVTCISAAGRPGRLALGLAVAVLLSYSGDRHTTKWTEMFAGRSFFGAYKVARTADGKFHLLVHGSTIHGATRLPIQGTPSRHTYYHANTGVGHVFRRIQSAGLPVRRIGAVGLGAGEIACYRQPGQTWTFFEIDPLMVRIAQDPALFGFLSRCAPKARIVLGDGRLTLAREPKGAFDLLILDAFSSDAIPAHLLTREAFAIYLSKIPADGLLMIHISNRHVDLDPVLAAQFRELGLHALMMAPKVDAKERKRTYRFESKWVAVARTPAVLDKFLGAKAERGERWVALESRKGIRPWTDNFSNVLSVLK